MRSDFLGEDEFAIGREQRVPFEVGEWSTSGAKTAWNSQRDPCLNFSSRMESSGRSALVSMMKTADLRNGHDAASVGSWHRPRFRSILIQREVCPGFMIVRQER
jgi:hypothetical protein